MQSCHKGDSFSGPSDAPLPWSWTGSVFSTLAFGCSGCSFLKPYGAVGTMTLGLGIPSWNAGAFVEFLSGLFSSVLSLVWSTLKSAVLLLF